MIIQHQRVFLMVAFITVMSTMKTSVITLVSLFTVGITSNSYCNQQYKPGLKLSRVIQVNFCSGLESLTEFIKYPGCDPNYALDHMYY